MWVRTVDPSILVNLDRITAIEPAKHEGETAVFAFVRVIEPGKPATNSVGFVLYKGCRSCCDRAIETLATALNAKSVWEVQR